MTKRLLMRVWGPDLMDRPEYATVELSSRLASNIKAMQQVVLDAKEKLGLAYATSYDYSPEFYSFPDDEELAETVFDNEWLVLDNDLVERSPDERVRVDYCMLKVTSDEFGWIMVPKHWSEEYATEMVPVSALEEFNA